MKNFSIASDTTHLIFSTSFYLDELNPVTAYDLDPTTLNCHIFTTTEILLTACFFLSIPQCVTSVGLIRYPSYTDFTLILLCQLDAFCHHFNKVLMYVCMYVCMYEMTVYPAESRLIPSRRVCRQSATFTTSLQQ